LVSVFDEHDVIGIEIELDYVIIKLILHAYIVSIFIDLGIACHASISDDITASVVNEVI